jgi:nucleotide-binding universal stress UspA family protein
MHILHATDGTSAAANAREVVAAVADPMRVRVTVMSVVPAGVPALKHLSRSLWAHRDRRGAAVDAVGVAGDRLRVAGFKVETTTPEGRPDVVIAGTAASRDVDLLVLGAGPPGALTGRLLGSTTTALLHGPLPVLVARRRPIAGRTNVVVGTDGSDHALRAARLAAELLDPRRCDVTVCSVGVLRAATPAEPYGGYAVSALSPEVEQQVLDPVCRHADEVAAVYRELGFAVSTHPAMGHPVRRLLAVADEVGATLLVVGSRGLSYPDRAFLGSISDQLVRHGPATLVGR